MKINPFLLSLLTGLSFCYALNVKLVMDQIDIIKESGGLGDQLYFHVLEQKSSEKLHAKIYPHFPFSYTKKNLKKFKPTTFWEGELYEHEHTHLTLSFLERELPPIFEDQLLATLKVQLSLENEGLKAQWNGGRYGRLHSNDSSQLSQIIHVEHEHATYKLVMHLESR